MFLRILALVLLLMPVGAIGYDLIQRGNQATSRLDASGGAASSAIGLTQQQGVAVGNGNLRFVYVGGRAQMRSAQTVWHEASPNAPARLIQQTPSFLRGFVGWLLRLPILLLLSLPSILCLIFGQVQILLEHRRGV